MDMNELFGDYQNGNYSSQATGHPLHQNDFAYGHENDNVKTKKTKGPKQKKGGGAKVFLLLILIIAIVAAGAYVYVFTDAFKTPKQLMGKYMMSMVMESENMTPISTQILEKETGTAIVDGTLTVLLNDLSEGEMEDANVNVDFAVDYDKGQSEFKIDTVLEEQPVDISIYTNKNTIAIGSTLVDISEDYNGANYVGIKNENLKEFAKKFEVDEETLKFIPDTINFDGLEEIFTEEEISDIAKRYLEILNTHLPEEKFAVEEKSAVTVDGKNYEAKKVTLKLTSTELLEMILAALEELKTDEVILNCYKKVVDIEIPQDKVNEYFDEMITELKDTIEMEKEDPSGTMEFAMYIYDSSALKLQVVVLDNEAAIQQETSYSSVKTDSGFKTITETYTPEGSYTPAQTDTTITEIVVGPTSEKMIYTTETKYAEMENNEEDSFSSFFSSSYEDTKSEIVYEIKDYSSKGYNDNFVATQDGNDILKFVSTVKFDEKVSTSELTTDNTVFVNDLSLEEMETLITLIQTKIEAYMPEDDYSYDDSYYSDDYYTDDYYTEDDYSTDFDTTNEVTDEVTNEVDYSNYQDLYVTPEVDDTEMLDTLKTELKNALNTCIAEAEKTDYVLHDYLNVENIKALCGSVEEITMTENTDARVSFDITAGGENFTYSVDLDGDTYTAEALSTAF